MRRHTGFGGNLFSILLATLTMMTVSTNGNWISGALAQEVKYPSKPVIFLAQSPPGGGFDNTCRAITTVLAKEKLVTVPMVVDNAPSSAVGPGIVYTRYKGDPHLITIQSISIMMMYVTGSTPYQVKDFTQIAGLLNTYYGIAVRQDSPYKTLGDLIKDLKEKPGKTPLSGGRSDDRVFYGAVFSKAGVDISKINYVAFGGGSEASVLVLEGSGKALVTTIDDVLGLVEAKRLRFLAVSLGKRATSGLLKDVPTLKEAGVDLEWSNTRYAQGPPSMPSYAVKYWQDTFAKMVTTPSWKEVLKRYNWEDAFMREGFGD